MANDKSGHRLAELEKRLWAEARSLTHESGLTGRQVNRPTVEELEGAELPIQRASLEQWTGGAGWASHMGQAPLRNTTQPTF